MYYVLTRDQLYLGAATPEDLVSAMLASNVFTEQKDPLTYMRVVAGRMAAMGYGHIRHDTAANFLHDLDAAGVLTFTTEH